MDRSLVDESAAVRSPCRAAPVLALRDDPDLLRRFREGEPLALSIVYERYVDAVESMLRKRFSATRRRGAPPSVELDDVVQEAFIKAFTEKARLAYDSAREYGAFLMSIARHTFIDHVRTVPREITATTEQIESVLTEHTAHAHGGDPWADAETMMVVEEYTSRLAGLEQSVYVARYVLGHSQERTAKALGLSRQRVRTLEAKIANGLLREIARSPRSQTDTRRVPPRRRSRTERRVRGDEGPTGSARGLPPAAPRSRQCFIVGL